MVTEDARRVAELRADLAKRIGQQRYELWFGPQTQFSLADNRLMVSVPSAFLRDWIRKNFFDDLRECSRLAFGRELSVGFEVDGSLLLGVGGSVQATTVAEVLPDQGLATEEGSQLQAIPDTAATSAQLRVLGHPTASSPTDERPAGQVTPSESNLMTFESLVVGTTNEFAANSARMLASGLHQASPALFWGATGVGKTHVLRSIQTAFRQSNRRGRVVYLTAEQFTGGFVDALRGSGLPSFRQKCRGADLLLIDDIHFLVGKRATLEELLHTIDALSADGRRLALASDRSLGDLQAMGAELVSRLSSGVTCKLDPPNFTMRAEILRNLCRRIQLALEDDVLQTVASQITGGARELQGALNRLQLTSVAHNQPITRQFADAALSELAQQSTRPVRLADIQKAVCDVFGIEPAGLRSESKGRAVSEPRMLAMWLARKYTRAPWSEIGQFFGRRSHSTVISAHRRVERLMSRQATIGIANQPCQVEEAISRVELALRRA